MKALCSACALVLALGAVACSSRPANGSTTGAVARAAHESQVVGANDPRHPARFASEVRRELDEVARDISRAVADGSLPQAALFRADQHRQHIEGLLADYGSDGYIDGGERRDVREQLRQLHDVRDRFESDFPRARGGGPRDLWR